MRRLWAEEDIDAPAAAVWDLLADPEAWPRWGPSVRRATVEGGTLAAGARGRVVTVLGVALDFEVTSFEPGVRWGWEVAGIGATDHRVRPLGPERCRAGIGVPWPAAPYLAVCRLALTRLARLATDPPGGR